MDGSRFDPYADINRLIVMIGLDILEHDGTEYRRLVNNARWTLASLNWAPRFDEKNLVEMERHNLTDEVFVLLQGKATLLVGDRAERVDMEPLKYYNVRAGIWHHIIVSEDVFMNCPYCSKEMRLGYFHDYEVPIKWIPADKKFSLLDFTE